LKQKKLSSRIKIISKNNFGAHRSEVTLFWGRFGCDNKKLSSMIILVNRGVLFSYFVFCYLISSIEKLQHLFY